MYILVGSGGWTNHGASSEQIPAARSRGRRFRSLGDVQLSPYEALTTNTTTLLIFPDRQRIAITV